MFELPFGMLGPVWITFDNPDFSRPEITRASNRPWAAVFDRPAWLSPRAATSHPSSPCGSSLVTDHGTAATMGVSGLEGSTGCPAGHRGARGAQLGLAHLRGVA